MHFDLFELYQESLPGNYIAANILESAVIKLTDPTRAENPNRKDTQTYLDIHGTDVVQQALEIMYAQLFELLECVSNPKSQVYRDNQDLIDAIAHAV